MVLRSWNKKVIKYNICSKGSTATERSFFKYEYCKHNGIQVFMSTLGGGNIENGMTIETKSSKNFSFNIKIQGIDDLIHNKHKEKYLLKYHH